MRSLERRAPHQIVEIGRRRVEAGEAGVDDRARAIDAWEERRGEAGALRRHAAPGGLEDGVALGMLHPDESFVAGVALLEIAHPCGKRVAGRDFRTVAGDKHRADPADPVWAQGGGAQSRPLGVGRLALSIHVNLWRFCSVRPKAGGLIGFCYHERRARAITNWA